MWTLSAKIAVNIALWTCYALSFYGSKMILNRPNNFGQVPIVLEGSNLFLLGPNNFRQVSILHIKISSEKSKIIWTQPKRIGPNQNNLYPSKTIWMVQNHFEPIEGQGADLCIHFYWLRQASMTKTMTQNLFWYSSL